MNIERLQKVKVMSFFQKKTIQYVEKSPWCQSETFKDLCRSNEYCFALSFIWITFLNERVKNSDLESIVKCIQSNHKLIMESDIEYPYTLPKKMLDYLNLIEVSKAGEVDYKEDISEAIDRFNNKGMFLFTFKDEQDSFCHVVSYKKVDNSNSYQFLDSYEVDTPFILFEDSRALKDHIINFFYTNMSISSYLVFIYYESVLQTLEIS